ncbi:FAD:protein FMN transferase [Maribacter sp. 2307ULW6-5]|uniref:FAD:protein FMN transferase n=1 Tax=Maribacter sp. 2307ULW6-5 TaxID=3386275 RepID=UPI0039BD5E70
MLGLMTVACQQPKEWVQSQNTGPALGTSYSILYQADRELDFQDEIDSVFRVVNQSLSTYLPESDISRINRGETGVTVDAMFKEVLSRSKDIHKATNGFFDPTVGTLVNAWGFGPEEGEVLMDAATVDSLMQYVGLDKVHLGENGVLSFSKEGMYLDFNAIAKGYAIDRLAVMLNGKGLEHYLVEVGGEIVAKGHNAVKGKPWSVGIDDPEDTAGRGLKLLIGLEDRALASSGNYRKFRIDGETGEKYVHTIDPKTGLAKNSTTLAVTVLADDCATADAFATAFMAMDREAVKRLVDKRSDLEVYIIYLDANGETQQYFTDGFKDLVLP